MMNTAFLITVVLGVLWSLVGAVVASARQKNCPIWSFYTCGSAFAALILIVSGLFRPSELAGNGLIVALLAIDAVLNALGQALTMYNLRGGARALLFAIPQMNFVVCFLFSLFFLGESATILSVLGILVLCGAILGVGLAGKQGTDTTLPNRRQLLLGIAAAVIVGSGQSALLLAGVCKSAPVSAGTKSVGVLLFSALSYGAGALWERRELAAKGKAVLKYGCAWGVFAALSYFTLFHAIDAMNKLGRGGLVFAIGCSTAILSFWLFSVIRMRDRVSWKQAALIAAIILGVVLLRL